jgi:hypothetical protein
VPSINIVNGTTIIISVDMFATRSYYPKIDIAPSQMRKPLYGEGFR